MKKKTNNIKVDDNSINIGNGNKISNSNIGNNNQVNPLEKKNFFEKHPLLTGVIASLLVTIFLVTKYGDKILKFFKDL